VTVGDDDLSDLSDEDVVLQTGEEKDKDMKLVKLNLKPTSNPRIKQLFPNTVKVVISNLGLNGISHMSRACKTLCVALRL